MLAAPVLALATLSSVAGAATQQPPGDEGARRRLGVGDAALRIVAGRPFAERPDAVLLHRSGPPRAVTGRASRGTNRSTAVAQYVKPVDHYVLSSGFGPRWGRLHAGLDFAAPPGTPVRAVATGEVVQAGWDGGYGWLVLIRHSDGIVTAYAHLSAILVADGSRLQPGEVIGRVGNTGHSTGPHLHFEVRAGDAPRDPMPWLRQHGLPV